LFVGANPCIRPHFESQNFAEILKNSLNPAIDILVEDLQNITISALRWQAPGEPSA